MLVKTETQLQSVLLPGLAFGAPEPMYVRLDSGTAARASLKDRKLILKDGGQASFDTFYNGFTVDVWRRHCEIEDLHLVLFGSGTLIVRIGLHRIGHAPRWLDERTVKLQSGLSQPVEIESWRRLNGGMLYFAVQAVGPATVTGGRFATTTAPVQKISLGVVITHYDRKNYLLPAIERLRAELLNDPHYDMELVIVDNSRNILASEATGVTVLPNRNLGGSGGFMRGLLHLKNISGATHCLFMDDDASCETDSIKRAYALLQFARTETFAVAGSLLREVEPNRLFEKGALFDGMCRTQKGGLDMNHLPDLLAAEVTDRRLDYGGWWFFAFAIDDVRQYAFPFFIRGDDIMFCMNNNFEICTANGIASWAEDFALKSGPLPTYLDVRSHLMQQLCWRGARRRGAVRLLCRFFFLAAFSYNYASARAVTLALTDVLAGPDFWRANLDMAAKRAEIGTFSAAEMLAPVDRAAYQPVHVPLAETKLRRRLRMLTLNGFLIPGPLLKKTVAFQHKSFFGVLRGVFRHRHVLYEYEPLGVGYVASHDKARFFRETAGFLKQLGKFLLNFSPLAQSYREAIPEMTSEAFWLNVYAESGPTRREVKQEVLS